MPEPINTTIDVLLIKAKEKLINDAVFGQSNCFIGIHQDQNVFPPGVYCVLSPGRQDIEQPIRVGAGRLIEPVEGEFTMTIWQSINLDQNPRDEAWLTDSSLGMIQLNNNAINSLELYQPKDSQGNWYMPAGFEVKRINSYMREINNVGWGQLVSTWRAEYTMNIANAPTT